MFGVWIVRLLSLLSVCSCLLSSSPVSTIIWSGYSSSVVDRTILVGDTVQWIPSAGFTIDSLYSTGNNAFSPIHNSNDSSLSYTFEAIGIYEYLIEMKVGKITVVGGTVSPLDGYYWYSFLVGDIIRFNLGTNPYYPT